MSSNEENVSSYFVLIPFLSVLALIILWVFIILSSFFASFGAPEQNVMDRSAVIERLKAVEVVAVKGEEDAPGFTISNLEVKGLNLNLSAI